MTSADPAQSPSNRNASATKHLSLAVRLILSSLILTLLGLLIAGLILTNLYRNSVQTSFDTQLETYANALIGDLAAQSSLGSDVVLSAPENIAEPRFLEPLSGWYWQVAKADQETGTNRVLFASDSLIGSDLAFLPRSADMEPSSAFRTANVIGPGGAELRQGQFLISLNTLAFAVTVTGNLTALNADIAAFQSSLILTFLVFAAFLGAAIYVQVRLGLRPLRSIQVALQRVQAGQTERIDGTYPSEIAPVVEEVNSLISANKAVVERARTQVGNLAHGLKTPLSVMANEANGGSVDGQKLAEQVRLMRGQIDHYLARARTAAGLVAVGTVTPVAPVADSLVRAMDKIYQDKALDIAIHVADGLHFRGEKQDLEELIGNLMDNACKWAEHRVILRADQMSPRQISLIVQDDGPGLSEDECRRAIRRGQRLDESVQGSGLGLSIIQDTVDLYQGSFHLRRGDLGGLEAEICLPGLINREGAS